MVARPIHNHMPSIPLPLVDGAFLTDNSGLTQRKCPRKYQYSNINKRSLADAKAGRNFGSAMHAGWAVRYRLRGNQAVDGPTEAAINDAMAAWLAEHPQPPGDFRTLTHAIKMMGVYNMTYQQEPFRIVTAPGWEPVAKDQVVPKGTRYRYCNLANKTTYESFAPGDFIASKDMDRLEIYVHDRPIVERSFALPLGHVWGYPIIYIGKVDLMTEDHNGLWSGPDHKTAFQFGKGFHDEMAVDSGQLGYVWATEQITGRRPRGYIIDAVRVRRASRGKASEYMENQDAPVDASDFMRIPFDVLPETIEEWRTDTLAIIESIFQDYERGFFPRHRWECVSKYGQCDYYDVCHVAKGSRESVLASTLFEDNEWSPLNPVPQ